MHRIFFDTNAGSQTGGYLLWLQRSIDELMAIRSKLRDGLHEIIYMPDELEMEAILKFDEGMKVWMGVPVQGTIRYLDGSA